MKEEIGKLCHLIADNEHANIPFDGEMYRLWLMNIYSMKAIPTIFFKEASLQAGVQTKLDYEAAYRHAADESREDIILNSYFVIDFSNLRKAQKIATF